MSLPISITLVDESSQVSPEELVRCAAALNSQLVDLRRVWSHTHSMTVIPGHPLDPGMWSIRIQRQLDDPGALGYHTDDGMTPYALVELTPDWSVTASHELLEMAVDPWGNRMHGARVPQGLDYREVGIERESHHVHYLLEVCDPCERTTYEVNGVQVSDFLLPGWYRTNPQDYQVYSFRGSLIAPRYVDDGGYVSFARDDGEWFQIFNDGGDLSLEDIGRFDKTKFGSLREFTDHHARRIRPSLR